MPQKRPFSGPALTIISSNIEGLSSEKEHLLSELCREQKCDVLCLQETHRGNDNCRPIVAGMRLVAEIPHRQYGSAIFVRPDIDIQSVTKNNANNIETISISLTNCSVTSFYKPPNALFEFFESQDNPSDTVEFVVGDFNSHSLTWGYKENDENGDRVEEWAESSGLSLIHDPKLPASFNSGRWKRGYNPDLIFASEIISRQCSKSVLNPIPRTQHRPIMCQVYASIAPRTVPFRRRYNFRKADWEAFRQELDALIEELEPVPENYDLFIKLVKLSSRRHIPRGCRTKYLPGMTGDLRSLMEQYHQLYDRDPFDPVTIETGNQLLAEISESNRQKWCEMVEDIDMTHNSKKAWTFIRKIGNSNESVKINTHSNITADQIAHQLLVNGKSSTRSRPLHCERTPDTEIDSLHPFSKIELQAGINQLKGGKAAGVDDICTEQIKNFGSKTKQWLLEMFNYCLHNVKIPKIWRRSRVIAILKPGKPVNDPKSYRPISLLCHLYKLFERIVLNRINAALDERLVPEQAGFRKGKSCTGQILNLAQCIEDGYEMGQVTGVAFVDLTAAYDTVNHRRLIAKVYNLTKDYHLTQIITELLSNRRFYVCFQNTNSRWRKQRNGLPQGSVLAPLLFNIYTNDQPILPTTQHYIFADDLALACRGKSFESVEEGLSKALGELSIYYRENQLKPNPTKTQLCAFHLRNREAKRELHVRWENQTLENTPTPKYLGVTLDRTLSYKHHCLNTKMKVGSRNNLLRRLTGTYWGANPHVMRTTGLALCYSAAEYACPAWKNSSHTRQVDVALNETCRLITGCLRPTPVDKLYLLAGIAPPQIRREAAAAGERLKQLQDERHPMYSHVPVKQRLKSRKAFLTNTPLQGSAKELRLQQWKNSSKAFNFVKPAEHLPSGCKTDWATWRALNRLRSGVARTKVNMQKWGILPESASVLCSCGSPQTTSHLCSCPNAPTCTREDLMAATSSAIEVARHWLKNI